MTTETKTETKSVEITLPVRKLAISFVSRLSQDTTKDLEKSLDAGETKGRAPLTTLADLEADFTDDDGDCTLSAFPRPDTENTKDAPCNNPDKYSVPGNTNSKGERETIKGTFYGDFAAASPSGQMILERIKGIDLAEAGNKTAPAIYLRMTSPERTSAKARETKRLSDLKGYIKRAMKIYFQSLDIEDKLPLIGMHFQTVEVRDAQGKPVKDEDDPSGYKREPMNTPKPIVIYNRAQPEKPTVLSITTFLTLDCDKAKENGGRMADLIATAARGNDEDDSSATDDDPGMIKNLDQFKVSLSRQALFFDDAAQTALIYKYAQGKSEDVEQFIVDLFDHKRHIDAFCAKLAKRNALIEAKRAEQSADEANGTSKAS